MPSSPAIGALFELPASSSPAAAGSPRASPPYASFVRIIAVASAAASFDRVSRSISARIAAAFVSQASSTSDVRSNRAASSVDASARVVSNEPSVSENIALSFKDFTASSTADRWRRVSSVSFAAVSAFATDATSGSALSSSSRLRETPGSFPKPDSEPLAAKEAPPNRPAAWIFLAAAWNRLAAPGAAAFFFEGDEYRPSMDFLRLP